MNFDVITYMFYVIALNCQNLVRYDDSAEHCERYYASLDTFRKNVLRIAEHEHALCVAVTFAYGLGANNAVCMDAEIYTKYIPDVTFHEVRQGIDGKSRIDMYTLLIMCDQ